MGTILYADLGIRWAFYFVKAPLRSFLQNRSMFILYSQVVRRRRQYLCLGYDEP